jgi:hypothetical protein
MIDFARAVLDHGEAFRWIFLLALLLVFYKWMQSDNGIEWRDFVSAEKPNGQYRGDINRVGQCVGVVLCAFAITATAPKAHTDYAGFALVLTACLAFLGGVASYAATLRAKQGRVETVTTTEPSEPVKKTVTKTEPAPTKDNPTPVEIVGGAGVDGALKVKEQEK